MSHTGESRGLDRGGLATSREFRGGREDFCSNPDCENKGTKTHVDSFYTKPHSDSDPDSNKVSFFCGKCALKRHESGEFVEAL